MSAYADSSFLVSLYIADSNSSAAAAEMAGIQLPIVITPLSELELDNAIQLRVFRNQIAPNDHRPKAAFEDDLKTRVLTLKPISDPVFAEAHRLASRYTSRLGTRTLDILHVAAAVVLGADRFLTFDDRQKKLAKAAGLVCK